MTDWLFLGVAFLVGLALGGFYFEVLWRTVQRLPAHPKPELLMLKSLGLRLAVVLPGFYLIMSGRWERLIACIVGFFLMREIISRRVSKGIPRTAM